MASLMAQIGIYGTGLVVGGYIGHKAGTALATRRNQRRKERWAALEESLYCVDCGYWGCRRRHELQSYVKKSPILTYFYGSRKASIATSGIFCGSQ